MFFCKYKATHYDNTLSAFNSLHEHDTKLLIILTSGQTVILSTSPRMQQILPSPGRHKR